MRTRSFLLIILCAVTMSSCGTPTTIVTPETIPTASTPDPNPESLPSNSVLPYGKNIRFEQLSLEEGLSQSVVNAILQDRKGFLWVGTDDGLNRCLRRSIEIDQRRP